MNGAGKISTVSAGLGERGKIRKRSHNLKRSSVPAIRCCKTSERILPKDLNVEG
jgi:hypothetical protein